MRGKRWLRLILCGLVAGVVFFLLTAVTLSLFAGEALSVLETTAAHPARGGEFFFAIDLLMGVWVVWLYAAISPRYGAKISTAAIAGLAWWVMKTLQSANWVGLGFVGAETVLVPLVTSLVSAIGAALAGAFLHDRLAPVAALPTLGSR